MLSTEDSDIPSLSIFRSRGFWKKAGLIVGVFFVMTIACSSGTYLWAKQYEGHIPPGVSIAGHPVGGKDPQEIRQQLQKKIDEIFAQGLTLVVEGETKSLMLSTLVSTDSIEDVTFDLDVLFSQVMSAHNKNFFLDSVQMFIAFAQPQNYDLTVTVEEERLRERVRELFPHTELPAQDASFEITKAEDVWSISVVSGHAGREFEWTQFLNTLENQLSVLNIEPLPVSLVDTMPRVSTPAATDQIQEALLALQSAPYSIESSLPHSLTSSLSWELTGEDIQTFLVPGEDKKLSIKQESFHTWVAPIASEVNQEAQDARFVIDNGRVNEFLQSKEGRTLDEDALYASVLETLNFAAHEPIQLVVQTQEPTIKTEDVNDLGIKEKLGMGTSSYKGSPANRKSNIQNGVNLLNGRLIAPGETFSLLSALAPFTTTNGYLPELVIKGDRITPEIGGGLCQIGTTTFRAVMNSGLPILQRQNHSIVVSYYFDPSNGNPGTDATIYDPAPDFQFLNDTGNYVLFQAENLTDIQELRFAFWGTSDGRRGSYEPPIVSRWIPVGETRFIETTDLKPGEKKCQSAHVGADASFAYTIERSSEEREETVFTSHYRPLPEICLVGVEPKPKLESEEEKIKGESDEMQSPEPAQAQSE